MWNCSYCQAFKISKCVRFTTVPAAAVFIIGWLLRHHIRASGCAMDSGPLKSKCSKIILREFVVCIIKFDQSLSGGESPLGLLGHVRLNKV